MQDILADLFFLLPFLHISIVLLLITKIVLILGFRKFDFLYLIGSYFRFYRPDAADDTDKKSRKLYVKLNNYINYYCYFWVAICLVCWIVFGKLY